MQLIADICVIPIGVGTSLSSQIAICEEIFQAAGLSPRLHANGTNVEGDWDLVMAALKRCHERLHAEGVPRISTTVRLGTRVDRQQSIDQKIAAVQQARLTRSISE